ncbi:ATP-grasp domain-containing protein [Salinicoccus kekensis]|uniref:D-alanine-D-alanine ligase-like ATP-grasp enzyme n=1 Tax=Salinicoccus kekensis TaxID=714307 RepID=A0A285UH42_9STAP|nr:ATP-grasp domain-containing protein [Salinicoccus kekensis]SOC41179.1 D-alanine-D-alanine ligase-like ATP-grasp enzyme [Salinicoccus kekensis]
MNTENAEWLNHLKEAVPTEGYGNKLSMYLIALEAWRRGIKVNFFTIDNPENKVLIRYSLEYEGKKHYFESSLGDKLSPEAFDVCEYKDLTKKYLADAGIKVPKGRVFRTSSNEEEYLSFAESLNFPVVVKPVDGNAGTGVFSNLNSEEELLDVINHLRDEMNYKNVIIEEFIPGDEFRVLTVDGKLTGAVNRIPANITGNGKDSIKTLIKRKNRTKLKNPSLSKKRIMIDREVKQNIEKNGYTLDSVLDAGKQLFLRRNSNVSTGGDPVEVTDDLPDKLKEIAEKATQAIPGLTVAGLDLIVNPENDEPTVIEVNTKPGIWLHVYPAEGKPKDVVRPIVDLYFPETKDVERSNLYFDFDSKIEPLDNITVYEVQVHPLKHTGIYRTKKFIVKLEYSSPILTTEIRLEALRLGIHGYVKKLNPTQYQVIAAGENDEVLMKLKNFISSEVKGFGVSDVEELEWFKPVNTGFIIEKESIKEISEKLRKKERENKALQSKYQDTEENLWDEKEKNTNYLSQLEYIQSQLNELEEEKEALTIKVGESERARISSENSLSTKIQNLETEYATLWKKYKNTVNSKSWRITKPLRKHNILNKKGISSRKSKKLK